MHVCVNMFYLYCGRLMPSFFRVMRRKEKYLAPRPHGPIPP